MQQRHIVKEGPYSNAYLSLWYNNYSKGIVLGPLIQATASEHAGRSGNPWEYPVTYTNDYLDSKDTHHHVASKETLKQSLPFLEPEG
jgi:hypothetical protein